MGFRSPANLLTLGPVTLVAAHPEMLLVPGHLCWPQEYVGFMLFLGKEPRTGQRVVRHDVKSRDSGNRYFGSDVDENTK